MDNHHLKPRKVEYHKVCAVYGNEAGRFTERGTSGKVKMEGI